MRRHHHQCLRFVRILAKLRRPLGYLFCQMDIIQILSGAIFMSNGDRLRAFHEDSNLSSGNLKKRTGLAALLATFILFGTTQAIFAQNMATIEIDTKAPSRVQRGFSGVNADLGVPVEYWDKSFNTLAQQVHSGCIRFPAGASRDAYNWKTGQIVQ